jgi:hypothetical protein
MGLAKKLQIKSGSNVLVAGAPRAVLDTIEVPEGATLRTRGHGPFDIVLSFVARRVDVEAAFAQARDALAKGGVLWLAYPKKKSDAGADLSRDVGWERLGRAGWAPVSAVSIDETWSALRFKEDPDLAAARRARRPARHSQRKTVSLKRK